MKKSREKNFNDWMEMYEYLKDHSGLYNEDLNLFVFHYNDAGALCYYHLEPEKALELSKKAKLKEDNWESFLGMGGTILDDTRFYDKREDASVSYLYRKPSLDFCREYFGKPGWINCDDYGETSSKILIPGIVVEADINKDGTYNAWIGTADGKGEFHNNISFYKLGTYFLEKIKSYSETEKEE